MKAAPRYFIALLGPCLALLALFPGAARAAVPRTMSYQGVLSDIAGGALPDGPHDLTFALYTAAVNGAPIWTESQPGVQVSKGYFSVVLGSITPLSPIFDQPYWLEVAVDGGTALQPRIALSSAPYALGILTPLPPGSINSSSLMNGPGIAQNSANYGTIGPAGDPNYANALSVTITTPGPGYILLSAQTTLVVLCYTWVGIQLTETSHAPQDGLHYVLAGGASPNLTNEGYIPASIQRTYFKAAGTYTFYLQGRNPNYTSCIPYMFNPVLTALYVPTSYGSVVTAAENVTNAASGPAIYPGGDPPAPLAPDAFVDLRDLELRAARSEAQALRAKQELEQAREKAAPAPARPRGGK